MFVIFLVQPTSPRNSETRRKHIASQGKKFRLKTVCLFQRLIIEQFIRKVVSLTTCLLVGFWESCELLHLRGVISFFLCFRSELATEVVLHGTIRLDSKIRSQNVQFHESFWREQNCLCHSLASILPHSFLVGQYAFLVGPYAFFRPYHFDAYGCHTGPFLLRFSKEIARGAARVIW